MSLIYVMCLAVAVNAGQVAGSLGAHGLIAFQVGLITWTFLFLLARCATR